MNNNLTGFAKDASAITITHNNTETTYNKGDQKCEEILNAFLLVISNAREMPAFGVSLDKETRLAKQSGLWLEFVFDSSKTHNDMPFDALLINVAGDHTGFNIIRKHNGKYDGRCFYLDIAGNMQPLFDTILDTLQN